MPSGGDLAASRFVRPDPRVLAEMLDRIRADGPGIRVDAPGRWVESGSSVLVYLIDDMAIRVTRQRGCGSELLRAQALVDALPALAFDVPRSLGEPVELDGYTAVAVHRLRGTPHPPGSGDPATLRALLAGVHAIDPGPVHAHLATPRSFAGGERWEEILSGDVVALLPADVHGRALERIAALADLRSPEQVVNHGDLAGNNVLWDGGRVTGVLDWDLTALEDPAEDVAAVATWHGWKLLPQITDQRTAARATVFRRSFPLQGVAFALINHRPAGELERAVARAEAELRRDRP